jgi:SAM-dependent methyltransferase
MSKISAHRRAYAQFFTPLPVVDCCYALLGGDLNPAPRIADPACGDGAFLRYAAERALTSPDRIEGCDIDGALVRELAAAGLSGVRLADGLNRASLPAASFDLVVGNPPFGVAVSGGAGALASEARFLLRALELARPGGRIALVLPSGVLANERLRGMRAELLARCTVLAVVGLPRDTFRAAGTSAACSILLLRDAPAPPSHRVFFALPARLEDLPAVVEGYRGRLQIADCKLRIGQDSGQSPISNLQSAMGYWLEQTPELARRLDAPFWRPDHRALLERMAARHPLQPLGALLDAGPNARQAASSLIAGDHVRPSRGEAKGAGLPYEYYQTREFMPAGYNYAAIERCDERAYRRLQRTAVRQHDILVSCAGVGGAGRGRVCLVTHEPGASCTGDVFILRVERPDPIFLFLVLASAAGRGQLLRMQNGVGTANLSADELLQVEVPLLPEAAQRDIAGRYAPIAAAHDAAMAALLRGDVAAFASERARSERLLADLVAGVEGIVLGSDTK